MKYQLAEHVSFTDVDEDAVLLDLNTGAYFGLNHIGAQLLNELKAHNSIENAVALIAGQYQLTANTVRADVDELIEQLLEQNLITKIEE
jgi:hypothetical protein